MTAKGQALVLGIVLTAAAAACSSGGGGGGGGGPTVPPPPPRSLGWTAAAAPGAQTVYLDIRDLADPDEFVLQIRVNEVSDLYGVAMDVVYPANAMDFVATATEEGDFLPAGGMFDVEVQIAEPTAGRIVIGYSRLGDVRGRNGNGLLLLLTFRTTANGTNDLRIEAPRVALDSDGRRVPTTWIGGSVAVQR